jgi:hypothetical protein
LPATGTGIIRTLEELPTPGGFYTQLCKHCGKIPVNPLLRALEWRLIEKRRRDKGMNGSGLIMIFQQKLSAGKNWALTEFLIEHKQRPGKKWLPMAQSAKRKRTLLN